MEDTKNNDILMLRLKANVIHYYGINQALKPILAKKEFLKAENMMFMKMLGLDKAEFDGLYRIEVITPTEKIGVDENLLIELIGKEEVDKLKEVPVKKLVKCIETGNVKERAIEAIITEPGKPYLKVFKLNSIKK